MALNLNKDGDENNNSLPKQEKKGLNLSKEEGKPTSKLNLSKDPSESAENNVIPEKKGLNLNKEESKPTSKLNLSKDPIEPAKDNAVSEKKQVNISKAESKPTSKLNLSKDSIETTKNNAVPEKKQSNQNTSTSKVIDNSPKKKSNILLYSLLVLVVIALAVFFINKNKSIEPVMAETVAIESPAALSPVAETPTVETPDTEAPNAETPVTETPAIANPVAETPKVETSVAENSIEQFASGTSIVSSPNNQQVKSIKDYLAKNANTKIILIGYASSEGDIKFNKWLSEKRAQSMKYYLTSNGIEGTRILTQGGGIENPIGDNNTVAGRKQNRRVEVLFK